MKPPTIRELLADAEFATFMSTEPLAMRNGRPHRLLETPGNWRVWVRMTDGKWKTALHDTYASAHDLMWRCLDREGVADVAITSRRVFFRPPTSTEKYRVRVKPRDAERVPYVETRTRQIITYTWAPQLDWCARCRRPSRFDYLAADHHALRSAIALTLDAPARCIYCGIRREALPADPYALED